MGQKRKGFPDINIIAIGGRLVSDPELRYTPNGRPVANCRIAFNVWTPQDAPERTDFVNIEVWGGQGEALAKYAAKGTQVMVEGELRIDQWEHEGKRRSAAKIAAKRIRWYLNGSGGGRGGRSGGGAPPVEDESWDDDDSIPF